MDNLINIEQRKINKTLINTVNARDLWKRLGSKRQFADWIKNRLERFIENEDYISISQNREIGFGKGKTEYFLTIETAKMICMLENNETGDRIRKYFIACEQELFCKTKKREASIRERYGLTDKIQELYGDKIETNKINGIKDWTYSNYTCLVYKKVFGVNNATKVKQMYHLSDKENIRESDKIPEAKKDEITNTEYSLHCYLQTLRCLNTPLEEVYDKVKQFLLQISIDK
ncbi:antA/AntB antirepressor family protein [uncultured Clostridium sp.]|uniref:antA/AntB antirepressor family protein n=1 Tax=uncultured Clostridium sp. TaxID=59620 RepID=UPI0025D49989|nr:antA/AntB antirepressor family protein [uncultured Clostridium sp.]